MRIITGKDYYDSGQSYSFSTDDDIVFVRQKDHNIELKDFKIKVLRPYGYPYLMNSFKYNMHIFSIIFCGKIYNGIMVKKDFSADQYQYFYDFESFHSYWCKENEPLRDDKNYTGMTEKKFVKSYFEKKLNQDEIAWLIENKISIACLTYRPEKQDYVWQIDGFSLSSFQFYRIMPVPQAYQELSMWIGGILPTSGNKTVEITDNKIKIAKHGFDKFSFRKPKKKLKMKNV